MPPALFASVLLAGLASTFLRRRRAGTDRTSPKLATLRLTGAALEAFEAEARRTKDAAAARRAASGGVVDGMADGVVVGVQGGRPQSGEGGASCVAAGDISVDSGAAAPEVACQDDPLAQLRGEACARPWPELVASRDGVDGDVSGAAVGAGAGAKASTDGGGDVTAAAVGIELGEWPTLVSCLAEAPPDALVTAAGNEDGNGAAGGAAGGAGGGGGASGKDETAETAAAQSRVTRLPLRGVSASAVGRGAAAPPPRRLCVRTSDEDTASELSPLTTPSITARWSPPNSAYVPGPHRLQPSPAGRATTCRTRAARAARE